MRSGAGSRARPVLRPAIPGAPEAATAGLWTVSPSGSAARTARASTREDDAEARALAALDRALAELPSEHRQLIELRYFAGQSLDEIAENLGLTARGVEGRLARLRAGLRESLARQLLHPDENA
jgi:RNA polymerase sigma factor (sigma-70 family)